MFLFRYWWISVPVVLLFGGLIVGLSMPAFGGDHASFRNEVHPILQEYCLECHVPGQQGYEKSGFDISTYDKLMKGTRFGSVIVPGDAFSSNLMVLIEGRADVSLKMPHGRKDLTKWEKVLLRRWINRGAQNN